jgi:hypothetical protein
MLLLARQYQSYFSPWVFFIAGNGHPGQSATPPGFGVELRSSIPFLLAGGLWLIVRVLRSAEPDERRSALFVLSALALYPLPGSLTLPTPPLIGPHLSRAIHLIPLLALVASAGARALADAAPRLLRRAPATIARSILVLATIVVSVLVGQELVVRYTYYYQEYPRQESVIQYFQYGLDHALAYARAHETDYDEIWVADVNQPYIYVLYDHTWPPSDVHKNLVLRRQPPDFNEVESIGKYHFGDPPGVNAAGLVILDTIRDPTGRAVYDVRGGETPARKRVLLIDKP